MASIAESITKSCNAHKLIATCLQGGLFCLGDLHAGKHITAKMLLRLDTTARYEILLSVRTNSILTAYRAAGSVITFSKTSNKNLDATLLELQNAVILPSYIPHQQRRKIFRPSHKHELRGTPVEMEIDGTIHKFGSLDFRLGQVPNSRKHFFTALDQMKTSDDWDIMPKLLTGLHDNAKRKFEIGDYPKMTRKAAYAGNLGVIIQCAMKPDKTGFYLDTSEKVQEIMSFYAKKAADKDFSLKATRSALQNAEELLVMMDDDKHKVKPTEDTKDRFPLRADPQIMATPLMLAAALRVKHNEDVVDKVQKYVKAIVNLWPEGKGLLDLHPTEAYADEAGMKYLLEKNKYLFAAAPILKGMDWAIEIMEPVMPSLARQLTLRRNAVAAEVDTAMQAEDLRPGRGKQMHEKLFYKAPIEEVVAEDVSKEALA